MSQDFCDLLVSGGPNAELGEASDVYAWLIGAWDVVVTDFPVDGEPTRSTGEWHFRWALEGGAVQDVWISPARADRGEAAPDLPNRYGTTVRMYDAARRAWRLTGMNPVSGAHNVLWARKVGADVVQEGTDDEGRLMRWIFSDITPETFRWTGERSSNDGATWRLEAEFLARRAHR